MKGLIAAGGRGTRLRPLTHAINKHLLPLAGKPLIEYAIEKMAAIGIREIAININPGEADIPKALGDGSRWGVELTFLEQTGGPQGVGHIVKNAEAWIGDAPFVFYLGDNVMLGALEPLAKRFHDNKLDCLLALARVENLSQFGVPEISDGRITRVIEKPKDPPSPFAVTGIYFYTPAVFAAARAIQPSARGEYEISDIHTALIEDGKQVGYEEVTGLWMDTGRPEDLLRANRLLLEQNGSEVVVHPTASVSADSVLRGPAVIGASAIISASIIGPGASISAGARIHNAQITESLILENATLEGVNINESIIGRNASVMSREPMPQAARLLLSDQGVVHF